MQFEKGKRPVGRQKGTPNKTTKALKEMILAALDQAGGEQYLALQAERNPSAFLTLLARVLPLTVTGADGGPLTVKIVRFGDHAPE